jgi:excisionase family DNA binding protein
MAMTRNRIETKKAAACDNAPWQSFLANLPSVIEQDDIPAAVGTLEVCKMALLSRLTFREACSASPHDVSVPLMSIAETAHRLGVPITRAYELARQGRLPIVRIGKYIRVDPGRLEAWIVEQQR